VTNEEAHRFAREKGVSRRLYALVRAIVAPFLRLYFRMHISGAEHLPATGAAIIAPNHKSFLDSFFIAVCTRRHVRFMAKMELIEARYGGLLVRLGAFPVRRGESDAEALETATVILRQGGLLALFPEGTRVRDPDELGHPRRGAGRLALESGAPLLPCAITGTERLFLGPIPKPRRVQVAFSEPIPVAHLASTPEGCRGSGREHALARGGGRVPAPPSAPHAYCGGACRTGNRRRTAGAPPAPAAVAAAVAALSAVRTPG
jgi:1-acyl-sn-glycerol-3-phosphate acyltransferase